MRAAPFNPSMEKWGWAANTFKNFNRRRFSPSACAEAFKPWHGVVTQSSLSDAPVRLETPARNVDNKDYEYGTFQNRPSIG